MGHVKFGAVTPVPACGCRQEERSGPDSRPTCSPSSATREQPARTQVNLGNFKVEVYFYPVKPAETIVIIVGQQESGATATER